MKKYDDLDGAESIPGDEQAAWVSLGDLPTMELNAKGVGVVDRYELIEKLGQGGFGAVYGARDTEAGILVALKALPAEVSCDESEMKAIRKNFALVSRLHHPHIASVLHLHRVENPDARASSKMGIKNGDYLVVMEYAPGATLSDFRSAMPDEKMTLFQALEYARPIATALDYAHAEKVLHRDVKPQNIIISREDGLRVKVLDFGLAAEIRSSMSRKSKDPQDSKSGTPNYMAPEQWRGKRQDGRADQYALAATIYELLSGEVAFKSAFDTGNHHIMRDVVVTETVEPLEELTKKQNAVLLRALSKEPEARFGSCVDFINALGGQKSAVRGQRAPRKSSIFNRKSAILLGLLVAGLVLGFGVWKVSQASRLFAAETQQVEQKTTQLLAAAQAALRSGDFDDATEKAQSVLHLNPNHSAAAELLLEIEKRAGERNARTIKIDTEMAVEKIQREITDRGQGFGEKLDSLKRELLIAQDAYASRSWGQAFTAFKGVEGICASIEAQQEVRGQALEVRDQMESQRRGAEAQSAESLAKAEWGKGVGAASKAAQAFEKGEFEEASKGWKMAVKSFQTSEEKAIAISLYRKAKQEWEGRISNIEQGISKSEVRKYAPEEWAAAERSARLGEASESEPVLGKEHYVAALASYKKAVEKTMPFLVPQMKWIATLNGKEVAATLKIGNQTFKLPETLKLEKNRSYSSSLSYSGCKTVSSTLTADWNGLKEKRVALEKWAGLEVGRNWTAPSTGMEFVWVPALKMWVGKYEVTNGEYRKKESGHDSKEYEGHSLNGDRQPVVYVNFDDAQAYAKWMTQRDRAAGHIPDGYAYRLPTKDEWMSFAQCGDGREYPWGDHWPPNSGRAGNYADRAAKTSFSGWSVVEGYNDGENVTCNVEQSWENSWGLYGVGGNVWECTAESAGGSFDAWRGAAWTHYYQSPLRCSYRYDLNASFRDFNIGFRLVLSRPGQN